MIQQEYANAFANNEKEANRYSARCMLVLTGIVGLVWILNMIGLFTVPENMMGISAVGCMLVFLIPSVLLRVLKEDSPRLKVYIIACCILGISMLAAAMPKHAVLAWAIPIVLSCHYYSRRLSYGTLIASVIFMTASIIVGAYVGEWDPHLLRAMWTSNDAPRNITPEKISLMMRNYALPRVMILVGINAICVTLASRTHRLLEMQVKDSVAKQQIESELNIATHIQTSMLPCIFPAFPDRKEIDIYATMDPAKEVGGDFYDFFMVDDRHLAIVMADVSGKGVPAALFMVIGKTLVKDHTQPGRDLGEVFAEVNRLLCESNSEGLFITAFEGVLDLVTGEFNFVNAGHEMPFIAKAGGAYQPYKIRAGFVLAGMEGMHYRAGSMMLDPGDKLFQYTDGVTEATNAQQELYGMERLEKILNQHTDKTPHELLPLVKADIDAFVGDAPQFDDITMLSLVYEKRMKV